MLRVGRALVIHEFLERTRDRWVVVVTALFALLASAVSLYGRSGSGEADAAVLTGPSLVTLASLLVPLVALALSFDAIAGERERNTLGLLLSLPVSRMEVVVGKFAGRALALTVAVVLGLGLAALASGPAGAAALGQLVGPTLLLGLSFLSIGMLISAAVGRPTTGASAVVTVWFLLVFFYDIALLALMVISDGAVSQQLVTSLVVANPAGLYRLQMMQAFTGPEVLREMGLTATLPTASASWLLWGAWLTLPVLMSGALLTRRKVV